MSTAIEDPDSPFDSFGRRKRLWNAVADWYFVAVSTNEQEAAYNCYPETPATSVREELDRLAERTLEDVLGLVETAELALDEASIGEASYVTGETRDDSPPARADDGAEREDG